MELVQFGIKILSFNISHIAMMTPKSKREHSQNEKLEQEQIDHTAYEYTEDVNRETLDDTITREKEDALRRKLDCFVAPVMMMLMLISYLDRGNIGFAATQGMTTDVGLKGSELNVNPSFMFPRSSKLTGPQTAVSVFYIFYILAEVS
jgi:hypothetical protein